MGTTKLAIYKKAIRSIKQTPIGALTDDVQVRHRCDDEYDGVLAWLLEQAFWRTAMRSAQITQNEAIDPAFAFDYAHDLPSDFVRRETISASEFLDPPLDEQIGGPGYLIEGGYIWANVTPLYMRYVSNDASYGYDLTLWTDGMAEAAGLQLGSRIAPYVAASAEMAEELHEASMVRVGRAATFDSLQQTTRRMREGTWSKVRGPARCERQ